MLADLYSVVIAMLLDLYLPLSLNRIQSANQTVL